MRPTTKPAFYLHQLRAKHWPRLPGAIQCFYASAVMFLGAFPGIVKPDSAYQYLADYVDALEPTFGKPGIGERLLRRYNLTGRIGQYWIAHRDAISATLEAAGVDAGRLVYVETGATRDELARALRFAPAIVATSGLPYARGGRVDALGGHIVLLAQGQGAHYDLFDPFGNPLTDYRDRDGEAVPVTLDWLDPYLLRATGGAGRRLLYWHPESLAASLPVRAPTRESNLHKLRAIFTPGAIPA